MSEVSKARIYTNLAWIVLLLLSGPGSGQSWGNTLENDLSLSFTTSKSTYTRDEPIKLSLRVTNNSSHPVILPFASAKQYDFVITRGGQEVWRWSDGQMFAMVLTHIILGPKESKRFEAIWLQTDRTGQKIRTGLYEAAGILQLLDHPLPSSISFEIR